MAEIQVGESLEWGIDETFTGYAVNSFEENLDPRVKVEVPDEQGVIKTVVFQDATKRYSVDMVVKNGTTLPAVGDTITGGSTQKYMVESCVVRSVSEDVRRVSMTLVDFEGITLA